MLIPRGVYKHYKGKLYLVIGNAMPIAETIPTKLELGVARHSETGDPYRICAIDGIMVAKFDPNRYLPRELPPIEPLVVYVPLYDTGGSQLAVRPAEMWGEGVPIDDGPGTEPYVKPRFQLIREA